MQHFAQNTDPRNLSKVIGQKRRSRSSSIDPGHARKESKYQNGDRTSATKGLCMGDPRLWLGLQLCLAVCSHHAPRAFFNTCIFSDSLLFSNSCSQGKRRTDQREIALSRYSRRHQSRDRGDRNEAR